MSLGTITGVFSKIQTQQARPQVCKLTLKATAGAAGDANAHLFPSTVLNTLSVDSDGNTRDLRGLQLYSMKVIPDGSAPPTSGSSITITDDVGVDLLGGKGAGIVVGTTKTWSLFGPSGSVASALVTGDITINITGNSTNSAVVTLILELIGV